jgi:hypothetical protein
MMAGATHKTEDQAIGTQAAAVSGADSSARVATLRARTGGYVVDMVIFLAIAMILYVIAGAVLLFVTDFAEQDPSDAEVYTFMAIISVGVPLCWSALNLALLATRQQTGGQYVAALRIEKEDGAALSRGSALAWWFAGNPLLFSWPMALATGLPLSALIWLLLAPVATLVFILFIALCVIMPIAALVAAVVDERNRGLHDRIAATVVVPA